MRKRQGKKSAYIWGLLVLGAFALTFQLGAVRALAQAQCSNQSQDQDCDGFTNTLESSGFNLPTGMRLAATNSTTIPNCSASGVPRDQCVDPTAQDLFVIIQRASSSCPASSCGAPCAPSFNGSDIPLPPYSNTYHDNTYDIDPLALIYPGLGVTTHELIQSPGYTQDLGGWKAVKIVEELDPCKNVMGLTTVGVPPTNILGKVYPETIKNWIARTCSQACITDKSGKTTCYAPSATSPTSFKCMNKNSGTTVDMNHPDPSLVAKLNAEFIRNVVSHETSHMMNLASGDGTTADHHWPIAWGYVMEQSIGAKVAKDSKGNITVTLYISNQYLTQDKTQHLLE